MSELKEIDKSIAVINFIIKRRKDRIAEISRKLDMTEKEKIYVGEETDLINNIQVLIKRYKDDIHRNLGRIPPQATELEEGVLGAILTERTAYDLVKSFLHEEHFYNESNKAIYRAVQTLSQKGGQIDLATVIVEMRRQGSLEAAGGAHRLMQISSSVGFSGSIDYHARVIVEMAIKRQLIAVGSDLQIYGYEEAKDCFDLLDYAEKQVANVRSWVKQ